MTEKTKIRIVEEPKRQELIQATYGIVGCMLEVYRHLGGGLPEYIYKEALTTELTLNGYTIHKEMTYHPLYSGTEMKSYLKMDLVVETALGNVIIECKALSQLTEKEHYQVFGYLRGTSWPIALLVNFGASPRAQIERYYYNEGVIEVF